VLIGVASGPEVDRSGLASRRPRRRVKREASGSSGWGTGLVTGVDGRRRRRAGVQRQHSRLAARRQGSSAAGGARCRCEEHARWGMERGRWLVRRWHAHAARLEDGGDGVIGRHASGRGDDGERGLGCAAVRRLRYGPTTSRGQNRDQAGRPWRARDDRKGERGGRRRVDALARREISLGRAGPD
jgi:hypothetical protein